MGEFKSHSVMIVHRESLEMRLHNTCTMYICYLSIHDAVKVWLGTTLLVLITSVQIISKINLHLPYSSGSDRNILKYNRNMACLQVWGLSLVIIILK